MRRTTITSLAIAAIIILAATSMAFAWGGQGHGGWQRSGGYHHGGGYHMMSTYSGGNGCPGYGYGARWNNRDFRNQSDTQSAQPESRTFSQNADVWHMNLPFDR